MKLASCVLLGFFFAATFAVPQKASTAKDGHSAAAAAFTAMLPALHSPRCMNCHSKGDYPRQGDDLHPHAMNVRRGSTGMGVPGANCGTCHQDHNLAGVHTPPGAPDWHLPPPAMPMIWEGLSPGQLCELFKDPTRNGGRTPQQIVEHLQTPLVLWGWHPGDDRTPVPMRYENFMTYARTWVANGAACPTADNR